VKRRSHAVRPETDADPAARDDALALGLFIHVATLLMPGHATT
jgi:hypothetical protein